MKNYLLLGVICTDFFTDLINRNMFDEQVRVRHRIESLAITVALYDVQGYHVVIVRYITTCMYYFTVFKIIKKMIKCCGSLQCHTQVTVLCQCLDEIDYATAFKALQVTASVCLATSYLT